MSRTLVFGLGILTGMVLQTLLIFIYISLRIDDIDKK